MTVFEDYIQLDKNDPLAAKRKNFCIPENIIYLNGNSLGTLQHSVATRVKNVVELEWGKDLIKSWNKNGWFHLPQTIGDKIATLIGAGKSEVVVTDSTSINIFRLAAQILQINKGRKILLTEDGIFPTDKYMLEGLASMLEGFEIISKPRLEISDHIDDRTAVVLLSHVDYKSGHLYDMKAITNQAIQKGAFVLWDLSHSAGIVPINLHDCNVQFAVGCTYKYLNGGPGSPAYLYVRKDTQEKITNPLSGWFGHKAPFAFDPEYESAPGITRQLCGTPQILSMAALDSALDIYSEIRISDIRKKSLCMTNLFIEMAERHLSPYGIGVYCRLEDKERGGHVCLEHEHGYAIMQALIHENVIGDFRAPNLMRFSFAPLYNTYAEITFAVQKLKFIMEKRAWETYARQPKADVT